MTTAKKLLSTQTGGDKLYVDDVFSTYLYTGNGSTQTITNGIDLAGKGGLVWTKYRNSTGNHALIDSTRGLDQAIYTNVTDAQGSRSPATFNSNGYATPNSDWWDANVSGGSYVSWTFRKAPKFFDVVTYTGNGVAGRQIPHGLGIAPGMIVVKRTNGVGDWRVYHRSSGADSAGYLNYTNAFGAADVWNSTEPTNAVFSVRTFATNVLNETYVAYLFAHDDSEDGIIQCGSFTTDASGNATVNLGWEPQCIIQKCSSATEDWYILDNMRGLPSSGGAAYLKPNSSSSEGTSIGFQLPNATGFTTTSGNASRTYIYLAIRRPNKPPTSGTEVYNAIARTGTATTAAVMGGLNSYDMIHTKPRGNLSIAGGFYDRLRGAQKLVLTSSTTAESTQANGLTAFTQDGYTAGGDSAGNINTSITYINHFFRRAPGFFDVVCHSGDGVMASPIRHGLGVKPQLAITKCRSTSEPWAVTFDIGTGIRGVTLNSTAAHQDTSHGWHYLMGNQFWSQYSNIGINTAGQTYVTYLFGTLPGISKVGVYTGNGTSLSVECGFSTGARFILAKSVDDAGDWFVWDTARGIVAANDPHLSLNTVAAEVTTDDSVDPYSGGFIVNQNTATNINITGKRYIFLAIA